jgi:IS5 family transposase
MVKSGTLIAASLVAADCRRPHKGAPVDGRRDPDANWNAMPEQPLFGYKMHLAVDQGSGLVRRAMLTPGHVSDKARNRALAALRALIERTFAVRKRWYGYGLRYRSLVKNILQLQLLAVALNLRRAPVLTA